DLVKPAGMKAFDLLFNEVYLHFKTFFSLPLYSRGGDWPMAKKGEDDGGNNKRPIIIKKIKKGGGGHHGGAWKVAYADFVTAMMAFFLLLWLLNVSTKEQLDGIADYFTPSSASVATSGAGGVLGGLTMTTEGSLTSQKSPAAVTENRPSD